MFYAPSRFNSYNGSKFIHGATPAALQQSVNAFIQDLGGNGLLLLGISLSAGGDGNDFLVRIDWTPDGGGNAVIPAVSVVCYEAASEAELQVACANAVATAGAAADLDVFDHVIAGNSKGERYMGMLILAAPGVSRTNGVGCVYIDIDSTMLTEAVNGTAQAIQLPLYVPVGAFVVGGQVQLITPFSGGGVATLDVSLGPVTAPTAIINAMDGLAAAGFYDTPAGAKPTGSYPNATMGVTFTPDVGHNLAQLTAGKLRAMVFTVQPPVIG